MAKMEKGFVVRAAAFLMIIQVLSRLLGYARDVVLTNMFGLGYVTDAFNAAFSIPDTLYNILIGGAMSSAFIPVFSYYLAQGRKDEAWRVSSIFTTWAMMLLTILAALSFVFAQPLMLLLTDYTTAQQLALPVTLTRITLIQALFMALSAIATGILQSHQHFTWPAVGTLLYNVCIILGGIFLMEPIEARWPGYGVAGFSVGVVIGAAATLLIQLPTLKKVGYQYRPSLDVHNPGLRQLVKLMIPVLIGLSVAQINVLVTQKLATGLEYGIYSALRIAYRFMQLPLGVFAVSIGVAIFPTMTAQTATNDLAEMKKSLSLGLRTTLFVILPSTVGLIMLREPIIRLLYEFSGKMTPENTVIAGQALLYYCLGLVGYAAVQALLRGFYALQDTRTPVLISVSAIAINILLSYALVELLQHRGLALAYSVSGVAQALLLLFFLRRRIGRMDLRNIAATLVKTLAAALIMALLVWLTARGCDALLGVGSKLAQLVQVCAGIGVGVISYFLCTYLLKMEEVNLVLDLFRRRLRRKAAKAPAGRDSDV